MIDANKWLADRGYGKAPQIVKLEEVPDPGSVTREELKTWTVEELRAARDYVVANQRERPPVAILQTHADGASSS